MMKYKVKNMGLGIAHLEDQNGKVLATVHVAGKSAESRDALVGLFQLAFDLINQKLESFRVSHPDNKTFDDFQNLDPDNLDWFRKEMEISRANQGSVTS